MLGLFQGTSTKSHYSKKSSYPIPKTIHTLCIGASSFNADLGAWDVSRVQDFRLAFADATSFNGDLGGWRFSPLLTEFDRMFEGAASFNHPGIEQWNVANILDMQFMFAGAARYETIGRYSAHCT